MKFTLFVSKRNCIPSLATTSLLLASLSSSTTFLTTARAFSVHLPTTTRNNILSLEEKRNFMSKPLTAARTALAETSKDGAFKRKDAAWRSWISRDKDAKFQPEADRYHLYVSYACPWAHRTLITRALKGLENIISVTVVHPVWQKTNPTVDEHRGWIFGDSTESTTTTWTNTDGLGGPFSTSYPDTGPDPIFGAKTIRQVYERAGDTDGKYSVPILWDKKLNTIVSNESSEIIRMLNSEFNDLANNKDLDLYPENLRKEIDEVNEWIYPTINNGVYRCGFATSQSAYNTAITELTASFDRLEQHLSKSRYLAGDTLTEADIRLFVTLVRFDPVYTVYFKTNTRFVERSPILLNYCRDIYQMPGVAATVNLEHIKTHYYCSHVELNKYSIIPKGIDFEALLQEPHDRATRSYE